MKGGFLPIGVVRRPHGVRGKIRVTPLGDDPSTFLALREILIGRHAGDLRAHRVLHMQPHQGLFVVELQGFTLEKANECVGSFAWIRREALPPLEEGEYYWEDLLGSRVATVTGEDLGVVESMMETGGNDVLVCRRAEEECLIPFIEGVVLRVDEEAGTILVDLPEGLR